MFVKKKEMNRNKYIGEIKQTKINDLPKMRNTPKVVPKTIAAISPPLKLLW